MYEKLFSPGAIGTLTIPNRIVMTAASASLSQPDGTMTEDMLAYYEARAKGGFGLLFTGAFHPDTLVDPVHPLDSKQPLKAPKTFQRSAVELLEHFTNRKK